MAEAEGESPKEMGNKSVQRENKKQEEEKIELENGVLPINEVKINESRVVVAKGSVVEFLGDAIVNAANSGCLYGGGVDGAISRAGGEKLADARQELKELRQGVRCETGGAVITIGGDLGSEFCIHAVGPAYGGGWSMSKKEITDSDNDSLLYMAYMESMKRAQEKECKTIGFALLSAGIFKGSRPLGAVLVIGLRAIMDHVYDGLEAVYMVGFMENEYRTLDQLMKHYQKNGELPLIELETDPIKLRQIQIKQIKTKKGRDEFIIGDKVRLINLQNENLLGQEGEVYGWASSKKRWRVKLKLTDKEGKERRCLLPRRCLEYADSGKDEKEEEVESNKGEEAEASDAENMEKNEKAKEATDSPAEKADAPAEVANPPAEVADPPAENIDPPEAKDEPMVDVSKEEANPDDANDKADIEVDGELGKKRLQESEDENPKRAKKEDIVAESDKPIV